jgi:hypothetical protein
MPRIIDVHVRGLAVLLVLAWFSEPAGCQEQAAPSAEQPKPHVYVPHPDDSESFDEVYAITSGGGLDSSSPRRVVQYAGIKLGGCVRGKHPDEEALGSGSTAELMRVSSVSFAVAVDSRHGETPSTSEGSPTAQAPAAPGPITLLGALSPRVKPTDRIYVRKTSGEEIVGRFSHASQGS